MSKDRRELSVDDKAAMLIVGLQSRLMNNAGEARVSDVFEEDYSKRMIISYNDQARHKLDFREMKIHTYQRAMNLPWRQNNFLPGGLPADHLSEHIIHGLFLHRLQDLGPKSVSKCAEAVAKRKATYLTFSEVQNCFIDRIKIEENQCVVIPYTGAHQNGSFEMSFLFQNEAYNDLLSPFGTCSRIPKQEFVVMSCQERVFM